MSVALLYGGTPLLILSGLLAITWLVVMLWLVEALYKLVYRATRCKTYADRERCLKIF